VSRLNIAIIPARGGSKRIPRKNIRDFLGMPMIAYSIKTAQESGCFDKIIVSTDDEEIAEIARHWGAETPFMRPAHLSDDTAGTIPVIQHAIDWLRVASLDPQFVCCIYATAPFLLANDLKQGLSQLESGHFDFSFSAAAFAAPVQRGFKLTSDGGVTMTQPECFNMRSQDLEPIYHDAGQFYWGRTEAWITVDNRFNSRSAAIVLPKHRVQDIDDLEDWQRAELLFEALRLRTETHEPER